MKIFWDLVIILAVPLFLAVASQCTKGLAVYFKEFRGVNRSAALQRARSEMKQVAPDLCLIAVGGDFGASSYIYSRGGPFLLSLFGTLLVIHFVTFVVCATLLIMAQTEKVRIWYNNFIGFLAILSTAAVILWSGR